MIEVIADLSGNLGPARDQGQRPTCMSFATSDVHRASRHHGEQLSTDALHCEAAKLMGRGANDGVSVGSIFEVLKVIGQVTEASWPYGSVQPKDKSCTFYKANAEGGQFDETTTLTRIQNGFPVGLGLKIGIEFYNTDGLSPISLSSFSKVQALHAVVVVGARRGVGGTEFLVRNSWGAAWALNGHAWVEAGYLASLSVLSFDVKVS